MLFESGSRDVPPQPSTSVQRPTQDATVPESTETGTPDSGKKKPKPKSKGKAKAQKDSDQTAEEPLRLAPTNYSKEGKVEGMSHLDPFNLSHDDYYAAAQGRNRVRHKTSKALVTHSTPACKLSLVPTHLTSKDLQNFHKPRAFFPPGPFRITPVTKERHANGKSSKKALNRVEMMKHKSDLSAREGRIIFTEYMEERPPLIENVGMGTRISNFYRKKTPDDVPILSV